MNSAHKTKAESINEMISKFRATWVLWIEVVKSSLGTLGLGKQLNFSTGSIKNILSVKESYLTAVKLWVKRISGFIAMKKLINSGVWSCLNREISQSQWNEKPSLLKYIYTLKTLNLEVVEKTGIPYLQCALTF